MSSSLLVTFLAIAAILAVVIALRWEVPPCNHVACERVYREMHRVHAVELDHERELEARRLHDQTHKDYRQPGCAWCRPDE